RRFVANASNSDALRSLRVSVEHRSATTATSPLSSVLARPKTQKIREKYMRPCLRHFCCVLLFSVLSLPALSAKMPVGVMRYEGETPDGSSIFHILLSP